MTHNGSLHIMIISVADIPQNQEITVAFDKQDTEIPNYISCACDQKSCLLMKKDIKELPLDAMSVKPTVTLEESGTPPPIGIIKAEMSLLEHAQGESETEGGNEDSRHEKLSREERKLQAYLKQFEKMEKKSDTVKQKHKDGKQPCMRTASLDESPTPVNNSTPQKPCLAK